MSDRDRAWRLAPALAVVLLLCALAWWSWDEPPPLPPRAPAAATATVELPPAPPRALARPIAAPRETSPAPRLEAARPGVPSLSSAFCANSGEESFTLAHTLPRKLYFTERSRLLAALPPAARARLGSVVVEAARTKAFPTDPLFPPELVLVMMASSQQISPQAALEAAERLARTAPEAPLPQLVIAVVAADLGRPEASLAAVRRLRRLWPDDPAAGWAIAQALRHTPELDEAIAGLTAYLAVEPLPALARLRARLSAQRDLQRDYPRRTSNGITLLWAPEAVSSPQADRLLGELDRTLTQAASLTGTRRRAQLTVVVYPGREELLASSCVPDWAGGVFDGTLRLVASPASPEGVDERSLRHEALHAQLMPAAGKAPRWFHEGLAESFSGEAAQRRPAWELMVRNRTWIPFSSLEATFSAFEATSDAALAYAQSLGLVELMRDAGGDAAIRDAVEVFQQGGNTAAALARACRRSEVTGADLLDFLGRRLAGSQ